MSLLQTKLLITSCIVTRFAINYRQKCKKKTFAQIVSKFERQPGLYCLRMFFINLMQVIFAIYTELFLEDNYVH
jgi:hypothetical protein